MLPVAPDGEAVEKSMQDHSANTKRIAKNTLMLYVRMLFSMVVSLYTSRVILATLGVEDYGISNVVGGVVTMFAFLNASMASSTQRFLTFELGRGDIEQLKKVFSIALLIHFLIAVIVLVLSETLGLWFLRTKLVIPEHRMFAANWVYQFSVISCCISIIQVPYNASVTAHERFGVFALIGIIEVIVKLAVVYLLTILPFDKLIWCSLLFLIVSYIIRIIYRVYCVVHFEECRFRLLKDKVLFRSMFSFAGWNVFGSLAWILKDQGVNVILNLFFGPIVNAARGVAVQVNGAVSGFVSNINTAFNPQITKNFAQGEVSEMEVLAYRASRFSFLMLLLIALPIILNIDFILDVWLKDVPERSSLFVVLILVDSLVGSLLGSPFITSLMATGNIRNYQIIVGSIILLIIPVSYITLKLGGRPEDVFYITIFFSFISGIVRYGFCVKQIGYSVKLFVSSVVLPVVMVLLVSIPIPFFMSMLSYSSRFVRFICVCSATVFITLIAVILIGLNKSERASLFYSIKDRLYR